MSSSKDSIPLYYDNYMIITQMRELGSHQKYSEEFLTY